MLFHSSIVADSTRTTIVPVRVGNALTSGPLSTILYYNRLMNAQRRRRRQRRDGRKRRKQKQSWPRLGTLYKEAFAHFFGRRCALRVELLPVWYEFDSYEFVTTEYFLVTDILGSTTLQISLIFLTCVVYWFNESKMFITINFYGTV